MYIYKIYIYIYILSIRQNYRIILDFTKVFLGGQCIVSHEGL